MHRNYAFELLGSYRPSIAKMLGVSPSAVYKWPEELPRSLADKVIAARIRLEWWTLLQKYPHIEPPPLIMEILKDVPAEQCLGIVEIGRASPIAPPGPKTAALSGT